MPKHFISCGRRESRELKLSESKPFLPSAGQRARLPLRMRKQIASMLKRALLLFNQKCGRRESNPHTSRHWILNPACLPIPPLPHIRGTANISRQELHFSAGRCKILPILGKAGVFFAQTISFCPTIVRSGNEPRKRRFYP